VKLSERELIWLGSMIDGEGTVKAQLKKCGRSRRLYPYIIIEMADLDIMARIAVMLEAKLVFKKRQKPHFKDVYRLCISGAKAVRYLRALLPYLSQRKEAEALQGIVAWSNNPFKGRKYHAERVSRNGNDAFHTLSNGLVVEKGRLAVKIRSAA